MHSVLFSALLLVTNIILYSFKKFRWVPFKVTGTILGLEIQKYIKQSLRSPETYILGLRKRDRGWQRGKES